MAVPQLLRGGVYFLTPLYYSPQRVWGQAAGVLQSRYLDPGSLPRLLYRLAYFDLHRPSASTGVNRGPTWEESEACGTFTIVATQAEAFPPVGCPAPVIFVVCRDPPHT